MNKTEFTNKMQEYTGEIGNQWSKVDCAFAIDCFIKAIEDTVAEGEKIQFTGFGSFEAITTKPKGGTNPKTGEKMIIPSKVKPKFKAGKEFKDKVTK